MEGFSSALTSATSTMKTPTLALFVCVVMGLTRAANTDRYSNPPITTEDPFGGWVPTCPDGWAQYSTRCLLYVARNRTWAEAEENCRSMYGHLATAIHAEHAREIHEVMKRAGHEQGQVWVGGHNTPQDPSWSWTDFISGEISHDLCRKEPAEPEHHCLQLTFEEQLAGCLDDRKCDAPLPSVCSQIIW